MFKQESSRALFILLLATMPMLFEMYGSMNTLLDWKVIIPLLMYTIFAFKAVEKREKHPVIYQINKQCCKASLCCVVAYAWITVLNNLSSNLVTCLLLQAREKIGSKFVHCQMHGLQTKCLDALLYAKKMSLANSQCPTVVIGPTLGNIYNICVILLRVVPTTIYGLWNLYTWTDERFDKRTVDLVTEESAKCTVFTVPDKRILLVCSVALLSCVLLEVSITFLLPLCSFTSALYFLCIVSIQNTLNTQRLRDSTKLALKSVQRTLCYTAIFHVVVETFMNLVKICNLCTKSSIEELLVGNQCENPHGPLQLEDCYTLMNTMGNSYHPDRQMCPTEMSVPLVLLYGANTIHIATLICVWVAMS